jgi:spermidine synthase
LPLQRTRSIAPALALMAASGFSALGLQIVWTQQSAAWLGHEAAAMLGVVTAFFGGLALGALLLGPAIRRSRRPLLWYIGCEVLIAAWALGLLVLLEPAGAGLLTATGIAPSPLRQWGLAFGGTLLLLLPATAAMGATLPAMERVLAATQRSPRAVAALYAANTAGAVAGVLTAAFWLVPALGLSTTAAACAALNLVVAGTAWWALGVAGTGTEPDAAATPAVQTTHAEPAPRLAVVLAATGCLGIGYEVLVVRALSQVAQNTVYTFALLLAVYLVGTAAGAAVLHRQLRGAPPTAGLRDRLLLALALACLLGSATLWGLAPLHRWLGGVVGEGMAAALGAEALLALVAFGPATAVMGALFSVLALQASGSGLGLGRALGWNTLGAALAPPLLGVLLLPALGHKAALLIVALGYLLLLSGSARRGPAAWVLLGAGAAVAAWAPPLVIVDKPEGAELVLHEAGAMAAVSVLEDAQGVRSLHIDNRQQEGSNATGLADGRQALLPLLLHPAPRQALFLGLGTGVTAATAALDRQLHVDAVELLPEVVRAAALFTPAWAEGAAHPGPNPRLTVHVADARRFVRAGSSRYDLIVSDNFHPARSGSAALYTVEHFAAVKARLAAGGLFCQWLPLHQMDLPTLRSIVRSYTEVFPQATALLATNSLDTPVIGLLARADGTRLSLPAVRSRLAGAQLEQNAAGWAIDDEWALLGSFVAGPRALQRWSAGAPLNTDDHPVVATLAPRITYAPDSLPRDRLFAWLQQVGPTAADELLDDGTTAADAARLQAYGAARQHYLLAGRSVRASGDAGAMLQQVQAPLLEALRLSPDFRPAYLPLVQMAAALARTEPQPAAALLQQLQRLQPAWPEAGQALQQIGAASR